MNLPDNKIDGSNKTSKRDQDRNRGRGFQIFVTMQEPVTLVIEPNNDS